MALNGSGPISLGGSTEGESIAVELGLSPTDQISLNDADVRDLADVPSGAIVMPGDFYGKSSLFAFTISSNTADANLATLATSAGWDGSSALQATINSGVYLYASSTGNVGLTISGSFPGGVTLINNGYILGKGGNGGSGAAGNILANRNGGSGSAGGKALTVSSAVTINNSSGVIGGGGGGGGGGGNCWYSEGISNGAAPGAGGGGGRSGVSSSSGGSGGPGYSCTGNSGGAGTTSSAGAGGAAKSCSCNANGGSGGSGGNWGASGSSGSNGSNGSGGSGGSAGACLSGNSYITWAATGTRYGAIS